MIYNRDLSWLNFNDRVLQEARNPSVALAQRTLLLGIVANNLEEFLRVRVAKLEALLSTQKGGEAAKTLALIEDIDHKINASQSHFWECYGAILEALHHENILFLKGYELTYDQVEYCRSTLLQDIINNLIIKPFSPKSGCKHLRDGELAMLLKIEEQSSRTASLHTIQLAPDSPLSHFIQLPQNGNENGRNKVDAHHSKKGDNAQPLPTQFIAIEEIIAHFAPQIIAEHHGIDYDEQKLEIHPFKIIRDSELYIDKKSDKPMVELLAEGLKIRSEGAIIRLIVCDSTPSQTTDYLLTTLDLEPRKLLRLGHIISMAELMQLPIRNSAKGESQLAQIRHALIDRHHSVMRAIEEQDLLLAYPYHTFDHIIELLREAADDPLVTTIRITIYRTAKGSKVIEELLRAAENGKRVTIHMELQARFDEEQNIADIQRLEGSSIRIFTGIPSLKVHSKLILIERQTEGEANDQTEREIRSYLHVGSGNFNESTASKYSDFALLTCNKSLAEDARQLFGYVEDTHRQPSLDHLLASPISLRSSLEEMIDSMIESARQGNRAHIRGKFNSLTDPKIIKQLYSASQVGVKVDLLIRGACSLIAGVEGLSDNIEVRSIIDNYLEHARMITFSQATKDNGNHSHSITYILSADLMTRNLDRRVEAAIPILDPTIARQLSDYFDIQWHDNQKARIVAPPYNNALLKIEQSSQGNKDEQPPKPHRSQCELHQYFTDQNNIFKEQNNE